MKIFERDYKINFVDINNVFVGFDYSQSCCEDFGYFIQNKEGPYDNGNSVEDVSSLVEDYVFDTNFFVNNWYPDYDGGSVTFKLIANDKENLYLTLYNHHNGYYGHGFEAKIEEALWQSGVL